MCAGSFRVSDAASEAQGIFHLNLTKDTWISSNRVSRNVENLKDAPDVDMLIAQISAFIPNERMKGKFLGKKISFPVLEAMNSVF